MKTTNLVYILLTLFWSCLQLHAQDYYIKTISITGTSSDNGLDILADETGYVVMTGSMAFSAIGGIGIFKTNLWGEEIWGNAVNYYPYDSGPKNLIRLPSSSYLISGGKVEEVLGFQDLFLFVTQTGLIYRTVIHGDSVNNRSPSSVIFGNNIVAFTSVGKTEPYQNQPLLIKLDSMGAILKKDTLLNAGGYVNNGSESILLLPTQEYILGIGAQNEPNKIYGYLRKTDTIGNTIWEQAINNVYMGVANMHLATLKNGNFVVSWGVKLGGATQDRGSFFVRCYNAEGDSLWQYTFASVDYIRNIQDLYVCANGDIIGCGYTLEAYPEYLTGWIFRLSPQGELFWSREFVYWEALGHYMPLYAVTEDPYGDIVATGYANRPDPETGFWKGQAVLLKVNAMGCFGEGGCTDTAIVHSVVTGMDTPPPQAGSSVAVSPVKVTWLGYGELAVFYNLPATPAATLHLYDIQGRPITNQPLPPYDIFTPLQTPPLPPGVYLYAAEQGGMIVARGKVAVMR
ncbi:MAG: hypothetical protein IPM47_18385 [Sphingobacteriales bacterium]|nr:MAG: hypothetical protein IPM47_18385 [Sphingobacteriales bacterium]